MQGTRTYGYTLSREGDVGGLQERTHGKEVETVGGRNSCMKTDIRILLQAEWANDSLCLVAHLIYCHIQNTHCFYLFLTLTSPIQTAGHIQVPFVITSPIATTYGGLIGQDLFY